MFLITIDAFMVTTKIKNLIIVVVKAIFVLNLIQLFGEKNFGFSPVDINASDSQIGSIIGENTATVIFYAIGLWVVYKFVRKGELY